ncbi:hypothetical protein PIB30_075045 [Stylosanthes scabra]|uniref:Uncharacterized protein n=1 Tax=Stylosanthes scabra TaxID=79078 RepID=A0ABU6TPG3_9FABA|nr:hypothetical protein [Stylosanthes scabra]
MEFDTMDAILAQNKAMAQQLTTLNKKLEKLEVAATGTQEETAAICGLCGGPHENQHCYLIMQDQPLQKVNYMGNQQRQPYDDPTSNIYSSKWRNHPYLGWEGNQHPKNNHFQNHPPYQPFQPPPFPQPNSLPPPPQPKPPQANFEPPKEEIVINAIQYLQEEDEEWCMRMDVIEGLNREVPQEEAMQEFQAKQGRYDVLDDTNQDFVMQELDAIVQKHIAEMQQEHLELQP